MLLTGEEVDFGSLEATRLDLQMRFADVDSMGVVHHAVYLHWFERLRFEFMHAILNISMQNMIDAKIFFPLMAAEAKYRYALKLTDEVHGLARLHVHRNSTFTFSYWIFSKARPNTPSATGTTKHCYVNDKLELLLAPPEPFRSAFARAASESPYSLILEGRS